MPGEHEGIELFKGIPFAAPPVGELRFRAASPDGRLSALARPVRPNALADVAFGLRPGWRASLPRKRVAVRGGQDRVS